MSFVYVSLLVARISPPASTIDFEGNIRDCRNQFKKKKCGREKEVIIVSRLFSPSFWPEPNVTSPPPLSAQTNPEEYMLHPYNPIVFPILICLFVSSLTGTRKHTVFPQKIPKKNSILILNHRSPCHAAPLKRSADRELGHGSQG